MEQKRITNKRSSIKFSVNFSKETLQVKSKCDDVFKLLKGKKQLLARKTISYKTVLQNEGEIKTFLDEQKLR